MTAVSTKSKRLRNFEQICPQCHETNKFQYKKTISFDRLTGHLYLDGKLRVCHFCENNRLGT